MDETASSLFPLTGQDTSEATAHLTGETSLKAAAGAFKKHMQFEGFSPYTIQAFGSDLNLLSRYLGGGQPIGAVTTQSLNDFMHWMLTERGVPCSPKTYARRVTTLKVFFKWLHQYGVLASDPAAPVVQHSVRSPLPTVLTGNEIDRLTTAAEQLRRGQGEARRPDARPLLLLRLLLRTGIKKGEAMAMTANHIDRSDPAKPVLFIRYRNPSKRYKERKIPLEPEWLPILDEYLAQYQPEDTIFTCTARNLEYILRDLEQAAGIDKPVSFECLRWTSAVQGYIAGVDTDELRERMGLSEITWRESLSKIQRLARSLESPETD